jgi:hypothetical protein
MSNGLNFENIAGAVAVGDMDGQVVTDDVLVSLASTIRAIVFFG